jgi:hypothetical protein
MFSYLDIQSQLLFINILDVAMFKQVFYNINEKNSMTKLIQLWTQSMEALNSLLALK